MQPVIARLIFSCALAVCGNNVAAASALKQAGSKSASKQSPVLPRSRAQRLFKVTEWVSLEDQSSPALSRRSHLDLDIIGDKHVEEIIVYGKRVKHPKEEDDERNALNHLGPATLSGSTSFRQGDFSGMEVTAAIPIDGVPGLDAVMNLTAGHDQLNETQTAASAAATLGLRLKF